MVSLCLSLLIVTGTTLIVDEVFLIALMEQSLGAGQICGLLLSLLLREAFRVLVPRILRTEGLGGRNRPRLRYGSCVLRSLRLRQPLFVSHC